MRGVLVVAWTAMLAGAACGGGNRDATTEGGGDALSRALVAAEDLPGQWEAYDTGGQENARFAVCGTASAPRDPAAQAATAWAQDPTDGPIFGERIEIYTEGGAEDRLEQSQSLALPCEWDQDGTQWRATREPAIGLGDDNSVYVIESLSGPKGYSYEVAIRRDDSLVLFVLNTRQPDRAQLEELVRIGWEKADSQLPRS